MMKTEPAGLYIHIPFCIRKCPYCDFYSVTDDSLRQAFYEALLCEMEMTADSGLSFDSLYIGGGTPSLFETREIEGIIGTAHKLFRILPEAEVTIEVNPGTVSLEKFEGCRDAGVNRLNIGVQSFQDDNLKFLGRIHSGQEASLAIQWAKEAGFENIGLDFIYGIPGQTQESWTSDLQQAIELKPAHLSCYMLTYEQGTPLEKKRRKGGLFIPLSDEAVADMFLRTIEFLECQGYAQYEISNFACSDIRRSRHNRKYWNHVPYLGFGPSAHSFIPRLRRRNHRSTEHYIRDIHAGRLPIEEKEILGREESIIESLYLGLRKTEGIDIDLFDRRFDTDFNEIFGTVISALTEKEFVRIHKNRCQLTPRGMLFSDSIAAMFIAQEF